MSNTGPGEIAELADDDRKFKVYMILSIQEIKSNQQIHSSDDDKRFDEIKRDIAEIRRKTVSVSSSVNDLSERDQRLSGAWKALTIVAVMGASILGALAWLWDHIPGRQP